MSSERHETTQDRRVGTTYSAMTGVVNPSAGGRFAREALPTVITSGQQYPRQPPNSPWAYDPVPREEPLGVDVNAMEPLGGPPERGDNPSPNAAEPSLFTLSRAGTRHAGARTFKRRVR
jgi:hypothetical protein